LYFGDIKSYFILQRVNGQTGNSTVLSVLSEQLHILRGKVNENCVKFKAGYKTAIQFII